MRFNLHKAANNTAIAFSSRNLPKISEDVGLAYFLAYKFSLYSKSHQRSLDYFFDVTADDLLILQQQHESAMDGLTVQGKAFAIEIATRRYLDTVDRAARDIIRESKYDSIRAESAIADAKLISIQVDRDALDTLAKQVELAKQKAEAQVAAFSVDIKQARYDASLASVETTKQRLNVARSRLDLLTAQQKVVSYQTQVVDLAYQKATVEVQLAQIEAEIAEYLSKSNHIDAQIVELDAQASSIRVKIADFAARGIKARAQTVDYEFRKSSIDSKIVEYQAEVENLSSQLTTLEARRQTLDAQKSEIEARGREVDSKIKDMEYQIAKVDVDIANYGIQTVEQKLSESVRKESEAALIESKAMAESWPARVDALNVKLANLKSITDEGLYDKMLEADKLIVDGQVSTIESRSLIDVTQTLGDKKIAEADSAYRVKLSDLKAALALGEKESEIAGAEGQGKIWKARLKGSDITVTGRINAATKIAQADVAYSLIHSIGGA